MSKNTRKNWLKAVIGFPVLGAFAGVFGYYFDYYGFKESYYTDVYYELVEYKNINPEVLQVKVRFDDIDNGLEDHGLFVKLNGERLQVEGEEENDLWSFDLTKDPKFYDLKSNSKNFVQFALKQPDKYFGEQFSVTFKKPSNGIVTKPEMPEEDIASSKSAAVIEGNIASNAIVKIYLDGQLINLLKGTEFKAQYQLEEFNVIHSKSANGRIVELTVEEI